MADVPIYAQPAVGQETISYSPFSVVPTPSIMTPPPPMQFAHFAAPPPFAPSSSGAPAGDNPFQPNTDLVPLYGTAVGVFVGSAVMAGTMNPALGVYAGVLSGIVAQNIVNQIYAPPTDTFGGSQ